MLLRDIYRMELGKGARDRHMILYRQYTDIVYGLSGRQRQDRYLDTPVQRESQSSDLMVFFPPLI